jgi:hypothetical protein
VNALRITDRGSAVVTGNLNEHPIDKSILLGTKYKNIKIMKAQ